MSWNSDCRPIANDLSLDQATRDVFTAWAAEGYAQGDPSTYLSGAVTASERPPFDLEAYPLDSEPALIALGPMESIDEI